MAELTSEDFYRDFSSSLAAQRGRLEDGARVAAWHAAILGSRDLFLGRVVLEVGSGLGLLSLLAAKAGAARVIALELPGLAELTERVASSNTSRVEVVQGRVGEVDLPVDTVDIILSDWMGAGLLAESLLAAVLEARDRWLHRDGLLLPDRATLHLAATSDLVQERSEWWGNVWGFDMSAVRRPCLDTAVQERVRPAALVTGSCLLAELPLYTLARAELGGPRPWALTALRTDYIGALVLHWRAAFSHVPAGAVLYSAGPGVPGARQAVLGLRDPLAVCRGDTLLGCCRLLPDWTGYRSKLGLEVGTVFGDRREEREFRLA